MEIPPSRYALENGAVLCSRDRAGLRTTAALLTAGHNGCWMGMKIGDGESPALVHGSFVVKHRLERTVAQMP